VTDEALFKTDLFALEILDRLDPGLAHDHVVSIGVVVDENADRGFSRRAGDEGVAVGHANTIELTGGVGVHGLDVVVPLEFYLDPFFFKPVFLNPDFPGDPSRPVAVSDFERL